jgi:hypothetical protein
MFVGGSTSCLLRLDGEQSTQVWFAIEDARKRYQESLDTECAGTPGTFGEEDVIFLTTSIQACDDVLVEMRRQGYRP